MVHLDKANQGTTHTNRNLVQAWLRYLAAPENIFTSYLLTASFLSVCASVLETLGVTRGATLFICILLILPMQFLVFLAAPLLEKQRERFRSWQHSGPLVLLKLSNREPFFISNHIPGRYKDLAFEEPLRSDIGDWPQGTVTTFYYNIKMLAREAYDQFLYDHRARLLEFINASYDEKSGLYRRRPHWGPGTAHYSYCALSVLKSISNPLQETNYLGYATGDKSERIGEAVSERISHILTGKVDIEEQNIVELYCSFSTLVKLNFGHRLESVTDRLIEFVLKLIGGVKGARSVTGFKMTPSSPVSCVSATYFTVKLLEKVGIPPQGIVDTEHVHKFLNLCWHDKLGGFSSVPGGVPTLVHTRMAFQLYECLAVSPPRQYQLKVYDFIKACKKPAGFAFEPDMEANAYASYCALELISRAHELGQGMNRLQDLKPENPGELIIANYYYVPKGVFSGYPLPRFLQEAA